MNLKTLLELVSSLETEGADLYKVAADVAVAQKELDINWLISQGQVTLAEQLRATP